MIKNNHIECADDEIDQLWKNESNWLQTNNSNSTAIFAKEGLSLTF